jgi:hypothetical protein
MGNYFMQNFCLTKIRKRLIVILLALIVTALLNSCNTTEPLDNKPPLEPDSTTQNFTFETFEFGDGFESNDLKDVWIFDENNIWAVGYIRDVVTNNKTVNIIRWDGSKWFGFGDYLTTSGLTGIWAIDTNNIYLASGAIRKYENGGIKVIDLTHLSFTTGQGVHKLWGSGENNIWGVGPGGTIVHFDGNAWSKIDFDEGWRFDAITGSEQTGIAYASATSQQFNTIIVELKDNSATIIYNNANDPNNLVSFNLELLDEQTLLLGRIKLWTFDISTKKSEILASLPSGYSAIGIAVNSPIDIYYFVDKYGSGLELNHFNGKRYKEITFSDNSNQIQGGADAIKDLAVMTGFINNKGYLVKVKRQ